MYTSVSIRRIHSVALAGYTDSAWFNAFKARKVLVFLSLPSKTGARCSYLLQATKVNLLAHARRFTLPTPLFRWPWESGNEATTTILKRAIKVGGPTIRKIHFESSYTQRGSSAASATSCVRSKSYAARLLKFSDPPNL